MERPMESEFNRLCRCLRELSRSYEKLWRGVPDLMSVEQDADAVFGSVLDSLTKLEVLGAVDSPAPPSNTASVRQVLVTLHASTKTEIAKARLLPRSEKEKRKQIVAQEIASALS